MATRDNGAATDIGEDRIRLLVRVAIEETLTRRLPTLVSLADLQARHIATSWQAITKLIENEGFPIPRVIGIRRLWTVDEIERWLEARPRDVRSAIARGQLTRRERRDKRRGAP